MPNGEKQLADEDGIRILSFNWYDGPRHFLTNKPVTTPADLSGVRIRTPAPPVWVQICRSNGCYAYRYGLERHLQRHSNPNPLTARKHNTPATFGARLYEVVEYINKTSHFQAGKRVIVGEKWFQTLPEEYQVILAEECKTAAAANALVVEGVADDYEKQMVEKGMQVIESDVEAFKSAAETAYQELGFTELRDQIFEEIGSNAGRKP